MLGTIVNSLAIVAGSLVGFFFKNIIPVRFSDALLKASALAVLATGIKLCIQGTNMTLMILSVIIGTFIGELIDIEGRLDRFGASVEGRLKGRGGNISAGFVSCTLVYCVGSMAIVGSIQSGLTGNHEILFSKAILDGIISVTMTVTLGIGVLLSSISVFLYQGSITLLAQFLQSVLNDAVITEMTSVGGVLIMAIGLNFLEIKRVKVGNMIPAVFIPILYYLIF